MKKLRLPSGPFERRPAMHASIAELVQSDPRVAEVAAKIWSDVTGGDGVLVVRGQPVAPADPWGVTKDLK